MPNHMHLIVSVVRVAPLLEPVEDWREFLTEAPETKKVELWRRHERTGRPLGEPAFLDRIDQRTLGRIVRPAKRREESVSRQGSPFQVAPRTDPYVKHYFIRPLPRVPDDRPLVRERMQNLRPGQPSPRAASVEHNRGQESRHVACRMGFSPCGESVAVATPDCVWQPATGDRIPRAWKNRS
jgi:hypothetical protein